MAQDQLQALFTNIEQLTKKYEHLKQSTLKLDYENKNLKLENKHLAKQHNDAKLALQQIMEQLKGLQT